MQLHQDTESDALIARETGLKRTLTTRQLTMIGIGGAIGTGLFLGSGIAIGYAGPGVLLSYVIAAFIALAVMYSLSEMAVVHPTAGSFGTYAERYINPWTGFLVRYTYCAAQIIAVGGEAIAVGHYVQFWWPGVPVWLTALGAGCGIWFINSRSVHNFGTVEYWLSTIKVAAILVFLLFGFSAIFGVGVEPVGFRNYTADGGLFPNGGFGVWMAVLMAVFSFTGIELIAVTAGEAERPAESVPRAMRTMLLRLFLFYFLALGVVLAVTPWREAAATAGAESPFVKVFLAFGVPGAATIMNFVVISASLSSMNTNLYLSTRMIFSLSRGNYAPAALGKVDARGVPSRAIAVSVLGILTAALTALVSQRAYHYLMGVALFGAILTWIIILLCHLRFRRVHKPVPGVGFTAPFFPYLQWAGLALLAALMLTMGFDTDFWNVAWIVGIPWVIAVRLFYLLRRRSS